MIGIVEPAALSGRVRKRKQHGLSDGSSVDWISLHRPSSTDDLLEAATGEEAPVSQGTDADDEPGFQQLEVRVQPTAAQLNLAGGGPAVAGVTAGAAWKAGGHRGHEDAFAHLALGWNTCARKPPHQLRTGSPGEGTGDVIFDRPRGLANQQDALSGPSAEDWVRSFEVSRLDAADTGPVLLLDCFDCTSHRQGHHMIVGAVRAASGAMILTPPALLLAQTWSRLGGHASTLQHRTAMPDEPPRPASGQQSDPRPTAGAPAWWGALGRPDLPLDGDASPPPRPAPPAHAHTEGTPRTARRWRAWGLNAAVLVVAVLTICVGLGVVSFKMFLTVALLFGVPLLLAILTTAVVARRSR